MGKDWWPEDETWPGEQLGEAFRAAAGKAGIGVTHQGLEEPEADFRARLAKEKASEHPEALWLLVVRE